MADNESNVLLRSALLFVFFVNEDVKPETLRTLTAQFGVQPRRRGTCMNGEHGVQKGANRYNNSETEGTETTEKHYARIISEPGPV